MKKVVSKVDASSVVKTAPQKVAPPTPTSAHHSAWGTIDAISNSAASDQSLLTSDAPYQGQNGGKKTEKHVLLLKPNTDEVMGSKSAKTSSLSSINHAISGINVNFCSVKKSGVVAIGFNDSETKKQAEDKIKKDEKLNSDFETKYPTKMKPKITIKGIHEVLFENCNNDKDVMKAWMVTIYLDAFSLHIVNFTVVKLQ